MELIYCDTNTWDSFLLSGPSPAVLTKGEREYLISASVLEEFTPAGPIRAPLLADLAWRVTNRRKLQDHLELTVLEIRRAQVGEEIELYDEDPGFVLAWEYLKSHGPDEEYVRLLQAVTEPDREGLRTYLQVMRSDFREKFGSPSDLPFEPAWAHYWASLQEDDGIAQWLLGVLDTAGLLALVPDPNGVAELTPEELPCTYSWIQFYFALMFQVTFLSRKKGRPKASDQADFRHACVIHGQHSPT